jgi:hypothetical protein
LEGLKGAMRKRSPAGRIAQLALDGERNRRQSVLLILRKSPHAGMSDTPILVE